MRDGEGAKQGSKGQVQERSQPASSTRTAGVEGAKGQSQERARACVNVLDDARAVVHGRNLTSCRTARAMVWCTFAAEKDGTTLSG